MFRKDLENRLKSIFGVTKVTFNAYSEDFEQDCIFVEVRECANRMSNIDKGKETARVTGSIVMFSKDNALPFGFFSKKIEQAKDELSKDLYFFNIDTDAVASPARIQNIHERRCDFVFLYSAQYDPNKGELTSLEL